jgi:hypothetical protein
MEILKDKKYIIGGLAIVGAIALFAYLKPKKRLNSDGFYGADGKKSFPNLTTNPFVPNVFRRQDVFCKVCVQYEKIINSKGLPEYIKRLMPTPYTVSLEKFSITEQEFRMAFTKHGLCTVSPPTK